MTGASAPWLAVFDDDDRSEFFTGLRAALTAAEAAGDAEPVETCLREWRTTAEALSDPERRAVLTGPGDDDDYAEVPRPLYALKGAFTAIQGR